MALVYSDGRVSHQMAVVVWVQIIFSIFVFLLSAPSQAARLYTEDDPVTILTSDTVKQTVHNSTTAWLVQFYSSWCGHCIQYSPTWKALAGDVKGRLFLTATLTLAHHMVLESRMAMNLGLAVDGQT